MCTRLLFNDDLPESLDCKTPGIRLSVLYYDRVLCRQQSVVSDKSAALLIFHTVRFGFLNVRTEPYGGLHEGLLGCTCTHLSNECSVLSVSVCVHISHKVD